MDALADPKHYMPDAARLAAIEEAIGEYNAERPAIMRTAYLQVGVYMGLYALVVLFVFYLMLRSGGGKHNPLAYVLVGLVAAGWYLWEFAWQPVKEYQLELRYPLFPIVFGFIDKVRYSNGDKPGFLTEINRMKLIQFTRSYNDDVVGGTHEGLDFEMVESTLKIGSGKNESTVFRGLIFHFLRDEEFPGLLVAARRGNLLQEWFHKMFGAHQDTIPTGDADLDRIYEIHTDNYSAAEPIVEGPLVSALNYLGREWSAGEARIALRGRECFLLLPADRDYFNVPSISRDIDYLADVVPMIRDMVVLLAVAHLIRKLG